jgi:hypothetical protein
MTSADLKELTYAVAQLRHAYVQLKAGNVTHQAAFADGLVAPQIRIIERIVDKESK